MEGEKILENKQDVEGKITENIEQNVEKGNVKGKSEENVKLNVQKENVKGKNVENIKQNAEKGNIKEKNQENSQKNLQIKKYNNYSQKSKSKKSVIFVIICILILVILGVMLTIFGVINKTNKNIISGVNINGINVSGMTIEQAKAKVDEEFLKLKNESFALKHEEYEISVVAEQVGLQFDTDKVINEAYGVGRNSNIIKNNFETIKAKINGKEIDVFMDIDEDIFEKTINDINGNLSNSVEQPSYYVDGTNLVITKGKKGISVDKDNLKQLLKDRLMQKNTENIIEIPVVEETPMDIDINKIYKEIYKEPKDAYISNNPFEVHAHIDGIDFEKSLEEVKQILNEDKEEYQIALKVTKPAKTTDMLGEEAFPDKLATYSTTYNAGDYNRSNNVELSARKLNDIVLMPGEEFSYNRTLGQRTAESGYKPAPAYVGGKTVYEYGGGICQTSSTLYNAVLLSNLEVTSRTNHCYPASYVPISRDATVSWGTLDFKFKNNRKNPIKIKSTAGGGTVKIDILGVSQDDDCEVEIQSYVESTVGFKTQYEDNPNLEQGTEKLIQNGSNGSVGVAYKILKKNGEVVSKTLLSRDTYSSKAKIISRGTKKVEEKKEESNKNENSSVTVTNESNNNKNKVNKTENKNENKAESKTDNKADNKKNQTKNNKSNKNNNKNLTR